MSTLFAWFTKTELWSNIDIVLLMLSLFIITLQLGITIGKRGR